MSRCTTCLLAFAVSLCATPVLAGTLASDLSSYNDGFTHWHGTTAFDSGGNLEGTVDWAVYAPGTFPGAFSGYTPNPTYFVYTYQVFETGTEPLSFYSVLLLNEAYNIGTFSGGGVSGDAPSNMDLVPFDSATWEFAGIQQGGSSTGLVFESPNVPMNAGGAVLDNGEAAAVIPVPSPDSFVPEPGTFALAIGGLFGLAVAAWRRRPRAA
jgi:hypothetical protein